MFCVVFGSYTNYLWNYTYLLTLSGSISLGVQTDPLLDLGQLLSQLVHLIVQLLSLVHHLVLFLVLDTRPHLAVDNGGLKHQLLLLLTEGDIQLVLNGGEF